MALFDLQVFIQERLRALDETMDTSPGSPSDLQVIQPILRRLGVDPFTVDLAVFISDRMRQAFPEAATEEGDAITDLLIKPAVLLWDPIVREIFRIRKSLSFKDPTTLTAEEAEALGANLFSDRKRGDFSKGTGRIYFAQPRTVSLTPVNFFTSRSGLHFFPDGKQDITTEEMLLNVEGSLYYFDVSLIAEAAGVSYDIGPNELINIANVEGTARVTNKSRFRSGQDEETATEYVGRAQQELTERSMVTLRGIGARIPSAFPDVTRLGVVGFGDPEMQRDVLRGGGLGKALSGGVLGQSALDGEGKATTRRFQVFDAGVDFTALVDSSRPGSYRLTVTDAFTGPPVVRDLTVRSALSADTLELEEQVLLPFVTSRAWALRKMELTLSGIPGGILFPDSEHGEVTIPDNEVHVGGMTDISVRGSSLDSTTLVIENITDSSPAASGTELEHTAPGQVVLHDLVLGATYAIDDAAYVALSEAKQLGFSLQILEGPNAGNYRVLDVIQVTSSSPVLLLDTNIPAVGGSYRWRLVDVIDIDLVSPRDTRVLGSDLQSVQHTDVLTTASGVNFIALGVSVGDTLHINEGIDAGDFTVKSLPFFNAIQVDRQLSSTTSGLNYSIFKANTAGGLQLPLARITKIELLDTTGQPVGSVVPYAKPIDIQSRTFENPGRGVKIDVIDGELGIVSRPVPGGGFVIGGQTLTISFSFITGYASVPVTFTSGNKSPAQAAAEINAAASAALGPNTVLAVVVADSDGDRVGIVPIDPYTSVLTGTAMLEFFGDTQARTSLDVRSASVLAAGGWAAVSPAINQDNLDVLQVLDGGQEGAYGSLQFGTVFFDNVNNTALVSGDLLYTDTLAAFSPAVGRHIQVGARSIGSARCYFLEPTSVEFTRTSVFSLQLAGGPLVRFFPDPTLAATRIPAAPSTSMPKDGASTAGGLVFTSASQDFVRSGIVPGDELVIRFVPIIGGAVLADPVPALALKSIRLSVDGGADQTIIFASDLSGSPNDVSRAGVAAQINSAVGKTIAKISSGNELELEGDVTILVRGTGTGNSILGLGAADRDNVSPHARTYPIVQVSPTTLTVATSTGGFTFSSPASVTRESYEVRRPGTQRISSTQMSANTAPAGLYYFDVELVSEGTGDLFNIDADQAMSAEGYRSDGYYLTTEDSNLTFSTRERPRLHISRSILEVGVSDDLANATQLAGQNIEVTYERSALVTDVQNFVSSETERVVCSNPLARHLVPHFVRFDYEYAGGQPVDDVLADLSSYVQKLFPNDLLESSDVVDIGYQNGARSVTSPIDLIAVVHQYDRAVVAQRSRSSLNTGRLAAFVPDRITVNRRSG